VRVVYQTRWESQEENEDLKRKFRSDCGRKLIERFEKL
jgi:hypothetical protein